MMQGIPETGKCTFSYDVENDRNGEVYRPYRITHDCMEHREVFLISHDARNTSNRDVYLMHHDARNTSKSKGEIFYLSLCREYQ